MPMTRMVIWLLSAYVAVTMGINVQSYLGWSSVAATILAIVIFNLLWLGGLYRWRHVLKKQKGWRG